MRNRQFRSLQQRALISSVRTEEDETHWWIHIWNRGGKAGEICVNAGDGLEILDRILPPSQRVEEQL